MSKILCTVQVLGSRWYWYTDESHLMGVQRKAKLKSKLNSHISAKSDFRLAGQSLWSCIDWLASLYIGTYDVETGAAGVCLRHSNSAIHVNEIAIFDKLNFTDIKIKMLSICTVNVTSVSYPILISVRNRFSRSFFLDLFLGPCATFLIVYWNAVEDCGKKSVSLMKVAL